MPYKCSVKGCRSNYDSTNEKVSVFQLPTDDKMKNKWLENIELNSKLTTSSSRVCVKHFSMSEIEVSTRRSILRPLAVPVRDQKPEIKVVLSAQSEDFIDNEDIFRSFENFTKSVDELPEELSKHWNIFTHPAGICFYRISTDENLNDLQISFKIIVNTNLRVRIFSLGSEASSKELQWILKDNQLLFWSQLKRILEYYRTEPEVLRVNQPEKYLQNALEALDSVKLVDVQNKIDAIKCQIISLQQYAIVLPNVEEKYHQPDEVTVKPATTDDIINDNSAEYLDCAIMESDDEAAEKPVVFLPEIEPEGIDEFEEVRSNESSCEEERIIEFEDPLKCPNCLITLLSEAGFLSHQKTCNVVKNPNLPVRKSKLPDLKPPKDESNVCDTCGKLFPTLKALKKHTKIHDESFRKKCPHCDQNVFSDALQRHINAVHYKLKPHKW